MSNHHISNGVAMLYVSPVPPGTPGPPGIPVPTLINPQPQDRVAWVSLVHPLTEVSTLPVFAVSVGCQITRNTSCNGFPLESHKAYRPPVMNCVLMPVRVGLPGVTLTVPGPEL